MKNRTLQDRIASKRHKLETRCIYGFTHFCDGKPNKSEDVNAQPKPRCPEYFRCGIRSKSIFRGENNA